MQKIVIILLLSTGLYAGSPIVGYERIIEKEGAVVYVQNKGKLKVKPKRIIDTDNIYAKGKVDNYDDPYIQKILQNQTPFKSIKGSGKNIAIVFNTQANRKNFIEEFGLSIFKKEHLSIKLYVLQRAKIKLPLNLSVYPFFVMEDRFMQGVITKTLLRSLIKESSYSPKPKINRVKLKEKLKQKFKMDESKIDIRYNEKKELFEVYKKNEKHINSYISKDGRYILVL